MKSHFFAGGLSHPIFVFTACTRPSSAHFFTSSPSRYLKSVWRIWWTYAPTSLSSPGFMWSGFMVARGAPPMMQWPKGRDEADWA